MTTTIKAQVTSINLGLVSIEGLLLANGEFAVAVPQIAELLQFDKNQASRELKPLLVAGFQFDKALSKLHPKAVNIVSIQDFNLIVAKLAIKGNVHAQELLILLSGLSLQQLFCDAFGIKFEQDDRQQWLAIRSETKAMYRDFSDAVQTWIHNHHCDRPEGFYFASAADSINYGLFGLTSKQIKEQLGITKSSLNRDHFGVKALKHIDMVQEGASKKMTRDRELRPADAVNMIIEFNEIQIAEFTI